MSSKVVKGEYRGFGEASVYWILNVLPAGSDNGDRGDNDEQCAEDAIDFVFRQSKGAVMSQKAQKRISKQKRVEVVWAGPAVVHEQRAASRISIGHRGATVRKSLFEDSDEGSSGGTNDGSGSAVEGGCSRAETAARQRSAVIRRDRAEVRRRAAAKSGAAGLAVAVKVRSTSPRQKYADKSRGWLALQVCYCICNNQYQRSRMRVYLQQWAAQLSAGIRAAKLELLSGGGTAAEPVKCRRFVRTFGRCRDPADIFRRVYTRELFALFQNQGLLPVANIPKTECGAVIQSAGTVLRTVMLFKSLESFVRTSELWAVECAFHGIFCNWDSWRWYVLRVERKFEAIGLKLWVDYACWLFCDVFPRWREAVLLRKFVRRMQGVVADMTVRGATRQWLAGVEAAADAAKTAAMAKATEEITSDTKIAVDAADAPKAAADATKTAAMAKATEEKTSDVRLFRICDGHGQIRDVTEAEMWALSKVLVGNFGN